MIPMFKKIVYATDLGEHNRKACLHALALAVRNDAELKVLHALEPLSSYAQSLMTDHMPEGAADRMIAATRREVTERIKAHLKGLADENPEFAPVVSKRVNVVVQESAAASLILETAEEWNADLIVLGSHSHSTLGELLIGSTARKVSQRSKIPVLLIPVEQ